MNYSVILAVTAAYRLHGES